MAETVLSRIPGEFQALSRGRILAGASHVPLFFFSPLTLNLVILLQTLKRLLPSPPPHLCSCLSRVSQIFTFNPTLIPQCGEININLICHTYHAWLRQKMPGIVKRSYFTRSRPEQTRALLALERFNLPIIHFLKLGKKKNPNWRWGPQYFWGCSCPFLAVFTEWAYTFDSCKSANLMFLSTGFCVFLETSYYAEGFPMSLHPYNKYH